MAIAALTWRGAGVCCPQVGLIVVAIVAVLLAGLVGGLWGAWQWVARSLLQELWGEKN